MNFPQRYVQASEFLDERPRLGADWKALLVGVAASYCCALGLRVLDVGHWVAPPLWIGNQVVMSTHDAYCWLAGAKGVNEYGVFGMSALARWLSRLFGAPLWKVGFWAPAFLGALSAAATALWGWLLAGRRGGFAAGCLGGLAPGFFFRSRLGYYDSDAFTLLMPLLLGFCLAHLLTYCCTRGWLASAAERADADETPAWLPWLALGYGVLARVAHFAHDDVLPMGVILLGLALCVGLLTARPGRRTRVLQLLAIYALAGYGGPRRFGVEVFRPGMGGLACLALAAGLAALLQRRPARLAGALGRPWLWAVILALLAACGPLFAPFGPFWAKAMSYFKPALEAGENAGGAGGPIYSGITQSIREARNVGDLGAFFAGVAPTPTLGAAGLAGILALLVFRPAMVLMLPLFAVGASSLIMGVRFSMFGGPAFALGLGVGLHWLLKTLLRRRGPRPRLLFEAQLLLAAAGLLIYAYSYADAPAMPVLSSEQARALMQLKTYAPKDAEVWTWWDFGYATQYYAERMTPIDGGRHQGRDIFPTALALTTSSCRQAAQVILLAADENYAPYRRWDAMPARAVRAELASLAAADVPLRRPAAQYLVISWEDLDVLPWITFYGSWDVVAGRGTRALVRDVRGRFDIDVAAGLLRPAGPRDENAPPALSLATLDQLAPGSSKHFDYPNHKSGLHLIINEAADQKLLMDDTAYHSMAVQLLINDPATPKLRRYFQLVHEGFPLVRIYEVLPPAKRPSGQAEAITQ